jgi:hypothetical protein
LLEAIDGLVQFADIIWMSRVLKTGWLAHICSLLQNPVQESIVDVKLPDTPVASHSESKN